MPHYYYGFDWTYLAIVLPCLTSWLIVGIYISSFKRYELTTQPLEQS